MGEKARKHKKGQKIDRAADLMLIERDFSEFVQLYSNLLKGDCTSYRYFDRFNEVAERLDKEFQQANLRHPAISERWYFYKYIRWFAYHNTPISYQLDNRHPDFEDTDLIDIKTGITKTLERMRGFKTMSILRETLDIMVQVIVLGSDEEYYRSLIGEDERSHFQVPIDIGHYRSFMLELADLAAKIGAEDKARRWFFNAFNTQELLSMRTEYIFVRLFFFENTEFVRELIAKSNSKEDHPPIILLTTYPHLVDMYQSNPFRFFQDAEWALEDKLILILDVIERLTFPLNEHDWTWFKEFRALVKPVCDQSIILNGLFKYFTLAEIFLQNGQEEIGFNIYKLTCQDLKEQLVRCPLSPYREAVEHIVEWQNSHIPEIEYIHEKLFKNISQLLDSLVLNEGTPLFSAIFDFFLKEPYAPSSFDAQLPHNIRNLFQLFVNKNPELLRKFLRERRKLHHWNVAFIIETSSELIKEELISLFQDISNNYCKEELEKWFEDVDDFDFTGLERNHPFLAPFLEIIEKKLGLL